jgi:tellurite resistance protein TerC
MPSSDPQGPPPDGHRRPATVSRSALRHLRRLAIGVIGVTVLTIGVAMIVLPGPATVVIPLGLGILAVEFAWARRMLERLKNGANQVLGKG